MLGSCVELILPNHGSLGHDLASAVSPSILRGPLAILPQEGGAALPAGGLNSKVP